MLPKFADGKMTYVAIVQGKGIHIRIVLPYKIDQNALFANVGSSKVTTRSRIKTVHLSLEQLSITSRRLDISGQNNRNWLFRLLVKLSLDPVREWSSGPRFLTLKDLRTSGTLGTIYAIRDFALARYA